MAKPKITCDVDKVNAMLNDAAEEHRSKNQQIQDRKSPAHGVYISPVNPTIVYVTVCCTRPEYRLASRENHELLLDIWKDSSHWVVGRYVLMPDHLHLFASPQPDAVEFDSWVKYFKSQFTQRNRAASIEWQSDHWDTRIRNEAHYDEKAEYMWQNPVRAQLVKCAEDWPHKGVVHELAWH